MKILNLTFALLLCSVLSSPAPILIRKVSGGGGPTYVINDDMEAPGFEEAWTEVPGDGTIDDANSSAAQSGTYSVVLSGTTTWPYFYQDEADSDTYTLEFWYRTASVTALKSICGFRTTGGSAICLFRQQADGTVTVFANGGDSAKTTDTMALSTWYKVRLIWNDSGTCSVEFNTSGTFDGTGNDYTSTTGGSHTGTIRVQFADANLNYATRYDLIQLQ